VSTTNNCIYAHTGSGIDYPPFINISRNKDGGFTVTVRSAGNGGRDIASIDVTPEQLEHLATDALGALHGEKSAIPVVTNEMVSRFLAWPLPTYFNPDCYVSFDRVGACAVGSWPIGTNLLDAQQARAMLEHVLAASATAPRVTLAKHAGLLPHQQRVVDEKDEVSDRLAKLLAFFQGPIFPALDEAERSRLRNQARFMDGYAAVLEERIAAFKQPAQTPVEHQPV